MREKSGTHKQLTGSGYSVPRTVTRSIHIKAPVPFIQVEISRTQDHWSFHHGTPQRPGHSLGRHACPVTIYATAKLMQLPSSCRALARGGSLVNCSLPIINNLTTHLFYTPQLLPLDIERPRSTIFLWRVIMLQQSSKVLRFEVVCRFPGSIF